jgi:hypothetical protein
MSYHSKGSGAQHTEAKLRRVREYDVPPAEIAEREARQTQRQIEKLQHENAALRSTISSASRLLDYYATDSNTTHRPRPNTNAWRTTTKK